MKAGIEPKTPLNKAVREIALMWNPNAVERMVEDNYRMRDALERIARWFGEFPPVERDGQQTTYGCAYGSNGERDFMRAVAQEALHPTKKLGIDVQ